ncbi:UvrD-helicase domain-containing protein [Nakamurella deserti]|uniref:UvrD-helicase domain-containing protein n=1 Tax=Nakamurella deserti TaxID=2164074 RepID=UPI000DBE31D5|nr:UvrD-helicase domain-containing protein [Nakamurella deserti]
MNPFDLCGELPTGTTVLEASAGTGKTHTVGALVARYVAEGHARLHELLVVTFGRAASQELRERVRGQLVQAERGLARPDLARAGDDELLRLLAGADDAEVAVRRRRLATALADFDSATIATTHQFCQQVLTGLGVAGDTEPHAQLVEDLDELVVEVVEDLYIRGFGHARADSPLFDYAEALALGRAAIGDPATRLEPADADPSSPAGLRRRFAIGVRKEVDRRKSDRGILGYDDLLSRLSAVLGPQHRAARERMRARWRYVLVDEFQDTDPVQWEVLSLAFAGASTLILIGDPKQAIYAFRGGDIATYLAAAAGAAQQSTLGRNFRSDAPLIDSLQVLLGDAALGDERIVVRPVVAHHAGSRLVGAPKAAPCRLRVIRREQFGESGSARIPISKVRPFIAKDLAIDIEALLGSGATFEGEPLVAGQVAVLVATHAQTAMVQKALLARGIPAVIAGSGSVFATPAADEWLVLLEALEQPHRSDRVRAAALTPFIGRTAAELATAGEELTDSYGGQLRQWADLVTRRGVAALLETVSELGLGERTLRLRDGERRLTDLRHVGQALHAAAVEHGLGLAALVEWLRGRRSEAAKDTAAERTRRLESDAAAVQVLTLHASKGLQYPVVYLPFAFDRWVGEPGILLLHDAAGERILDMGGAGSVGRPERERRAAAEAAGESLRLFYVGVTRAQSQVVLWWAPTANTWSSALHRLIFGRTPGRSTVPDTAPAVGDVEAHQRFATLAAAGGPSVEPALFVDLPPDPPPGEALPALEVGRFRRELDVAWRRTSYSALSAAADHVPGAAGSGPDVTSEPETGERADEDLPVLVLPAEPPADDLPSPMADLPKGTGFGTLVHAVLEHVDPLASDLGAELLERCVEEVSHRPGLVDAAELAAALLPVLRTPLGPLADGRTLADIALPDRLAELDFELPLAGGDRIEADVTLAELAPLLRQHLPADDPLLSYVDRLETPELGGQALRGYLTGSLDLVVRLPGPRYLVADYKTNWLGEGPDTPLTAWHYRPDALDRVMAQSDYPLQAMLYCVALHRFLRWRQPGYRPELHLGGVLYLYVRGMCGPDTPVVDGRVSGVFGWQPPGALVAALSDLLDGVPAPAGRA